MSKETAINSIARQLARYFGKVKSWAITGEPDREKFTKQATELLRLAELEGYVFRDPLKDKFYNPLKVLDELKKFRQSMGEYMRDMDVLMEQLKTNDPIAVKNLTEYGIEWGRLRKKLFDNYVMSGLELEQFLRTNGTDREIAEMIALKIGTFCQKAGHYCSTGICGDCDYREIKWEEVNKK